MNGGIHKKTDVAVDISLSENLNRLTFSLFIILRDQRSFFILLNIPR